MAHHDQDAEELILYADNTGELYADKKAAVRRVQDAMNRGTYNRRLGQAIWASWITRAATRYGREIGGRFSLVEKRKAAAELERREHDKIKRGEWSHATSSDRHRRAPARRRPAAKKRASRRRSRR